MRQNNRMERFGVSVKHGSALDLVGAPTRFKSSIILSIIVSLRSNYAPTLVSHLGWSGAMARGVPGGDPRGSNFLIMDRHQT